jgi:hypothetical protein
MAVAGWFRGKTTPDVGATHLGLRDLGLELLHGVEELVDGLLLHRHLLLKRHRHLHLLLPPGQRLASKVLVPLHSVGRSHTHMQT